MRLNRYIASATGLSRRAADTAIRDQRIAINGQVAGLGVAVATDDVVTLDGATLSLPTTFRYIALNKPEGYISSRTRQGKSPIVYDLLPPADHNLRLAGRLDRDSSGLILLSNDGNFILQMSHPSADKRKIYEVTLDHSPSTKDLAQLDRGVVLDDGLSLIAVLATNGSTITVSLEEGRNRQIRRTLGALGYGITRLHRLSIGPYQLGDLQPGQWREITP